MTPIRLAMIAALVLPAGIALAGAPRQDQSGCPMHASHTAATHDHDAHAAEVDARGDTVMGFAHDRTAHHFRLTPGGGRIEVVATDAADVASRDQIRRHLRAVAAAFADGDFAMPAAIHGTQPPGAAEMKASYTKIRYTYEDLDAGGRVRIETADPALVDAVHAFLRFQIDEHRTGDPTAIE
jgi:hypothetical protein